jgi:hypothetical protein
MRIDERIARLIQVALMAAVCTALSVSGAAAAQGGGDRHADLARQLERQFTMLPIVGGVVLTPKTSIGGVRSVELSNGTLSIDGTAVTGAELREKLGADADAVLQLSYLSPAEQRALVSAGASEPATPPQARPRGREFDFQFPPRARGGDAVNFARDTRVERGDVVNGNAISVGGSVTVLGEVRGDAVAIGGDMDLGPTAVVTGRVVVVGGRLRQDPAARVGGGVRQIGWNDARFGSFWRRSWDRTTLSGWSFAAPLALIAQIIRLGVMCLLTVLVVLVGGNVVDRIGRRAAAEPFKAGAIGLLSQLLFLPLLVVIIILLCITIVGIPLLALIPFAVLGLALVGLVGFAAVALRVGQAVGERLAWSGGPYLLAVTGVIVLLAPILIARLIGLAGFPLSLFSAVLAGVGLVLEYIAWTIGFGAVALTRFSKSSAPPAPSAG